MPNNWFDIKQKYLQQLTSIYSNNEAKQLLKITFEEFYPKNAIVEFNHPSFTINDDVKKRFDEVIQRLLKHEPIQYILNKAWFLDDTYYVDNHVLIPRPETEELVNAIQKQHPNFEGQLIDIGTGSGCIPISLAKAFPQAKIIAVDVEKGALQVAQKNAKTHQVAIEFKQGDFLSNSFRNTLNKIDIIVSNPPYIPYQEKNMMSESTKQYEPKSALYVENDNALIFYEALLNFAQEKLVDSGWVYLECNEYNAKDVDKLFKSANFESEIIKDLQGKDRILKAQKQ